MCGPGEGQHFERRHVERPIFRNFKIKNIKNLARDFSGPKVSPRVSDRIICMSPGETLFETRSFYAGSEFRNFEYYKTKVELFDFSIFEFIFYFYVCLNDSNIRNTYMIIYQIRNLDSFTDCQILKIC